MSANPRQPSFDDLGQPLSQTTFCVVDLETTGGTSESQITEIGAVKVRGGEVLGDFHTLVCPEVEIPEKIQALTGITNQMVAKAPSLAEALPLFHSFSRGSVMVAHNARFDMSFLRRGYAQTGIVWAEPTVIDTLSLARSVLAAGEVRNHKLGTLAEYFHARTQPDHRALSDARATVDIFHALVERVGNLSVDTLEDLTEMISRVPAAQRTKRSWVQQIPEAPGVYWFVYDGTAADGSPRHEVLYVGKSINLRRRVRSYFSAAQPRARMHEMVKVATGVKHLVCATGLEAEVRELRMIQSHLPRYNRRSKNQHALHWLKLTIEPFPRISLVRAVRGDGAHYWGPFTSAVNAREAMMLLQSACGIRPCTKRLSATRKSSRCAHADLGQCLAPCELGVGAGQYQDAVAKLRQAWNLDMQPVLHFAQQRRQMLVSEERFEEAGELTRRLDLVHATSRRFHRVRSIASCPQIVAAAPEGTTWAVHVLRYGYLAGAAQCTTSQVIKTASELEAMAATVSAPITGMPAGSFEEAERVAAWLEQPGVRLLKIDGEWAWPINVVVS